MQRDELVAQLKDVVGTALEDWARSSHVDEVRKALGLSAEEVVVTHDSVLVFDPQDQRSDIELRRLHRIIQNAAHIAGQAYEHADKAPKTRRLNRQRARLKVMHQSLSQVARLLAGDDLDKQADKPFVDPALTEIARYALMGVNTTSSKKRQEYLEAIYELCDADIISSLSEIEDEDEMDSLDPVSPDKLKLAQVHKKLRELQAEIRSDKTLRLDKEELCRRIEEIMLNIRGENNG